MPFVVPIDRDGGLLTHQMYMGLRAAILSGTLRPGERLPSTRDMSEQTGVSRTVILLAYDQLRTEGFLEGRAGSGTFVSTQLKRIDSRASGETASLRLSRIGSAAAGAVPADPPSRGTLRYDFTYGRGSLETFPFEAWRKILIRKVRQAPVRAFDYGAAQGSEALREAVAGHLRRSRAVVCDTSQVIIVNGSQQALDLTARVMLDPGDRVVLENPHYQGTRQVLLAAGAELHLARVDDDGLVTDELPDEARMAFVTPSHQIPTGTMLPLGRRLALLDWARRVNATVLEDDYDGEFHYEGEPVESMQGLDTEGRVIYTGTFSRTVFPALRIGYLIAPKSLLKAFSAAKWLCDRHTATLEQEALAEFISSGAYERHLRALRRANAARRGVLLEAVAEYLGERVTVTGQHSGAHIVIWPKGVIDENAVILDAAARGVGIAGTARYYPGAPGRTGFILGYSRMAEGEIREGVRRLSLTAL